MKTRSICIRAALAAAALASFAVPPSASAATFRPSALFVFGDSLVDVGNVAVALGNDSRTPAARGYFQNRFTDGPTYVDLLNRQLYGSYQTPALAGGTNYAFGGARIVDNSAYATGGDPIPDLAAQIGLYVAGRAVDPNALYILNAGGNDAFAIGRGEIGGLSVSDYATTVATTLTGAIRTLDTLGARNILVTGIPNNASLDAVVQSALDTLTPALSTRLLRFDYLDFYSRVLADPTAYGVDPITQSGACFDSRTPVGGVIDCSGFATVDNIHPIAKIQAAAAREIATLTGIAAVPEPASWLLMILGFALIGRQARRHATRPAYSSSER